MSEVPDFCNVYDDAWEGYFKDWLLARHNLLPVRVYAMSDPFGWLARNCVCEATVDSIDHPGFEHSVVIEYGLITHDPHPSKRSLALTLNDVKDITLFVAMEPAAFGSPLHD